MDNISIFGIRHPINTIFSENVTVDDFMHLGIKCPINTICCQDCKYLFKKYKTWNCIQNQLNDILNSLSIIVFYRVIYYE